VVDRDGQRRAADRRCPWFRTVRWIASRFRQAMLASVIIIPPLINLRIV
jgi:hypothetical protein